MRLFNESFITMASTLPSSLLLFGCLLILLAACELNDVPVQVAEPTPTATLPPLALAVDVEDEAVIVSIPSDPPSFNAYLNDTGYEALIGELVYGALVEIGPDGNYYQELALNVPTLANGDLSEDGLTVTWRLRPDVLWSDGQPFSAADVRFTWQALRDSGIWAPGFDLIEDVETPDPLTAIVKYREFYPNYLIQFGGQGTGIFPAHYCGPTTEMLIWECNFEPISTGPFILSQWIPGVRLTFAPNPTYFIPERPLATQLVFEIQPDPDFRQRSLERATTHLDLWPEGDSLRRMEDSGTVNVFRTNSARFVLRLVPNFSAPGSDPTVPHAALADPRVRLALRYAIEVGRLNDEVFNNRGILVDTELFQLDCDIPPYPYNPGLAAALLNDAGWVLTDPDQTIRACQGCKTVADGTALTLISYTYLEGGAEIEQAHRLLKEMFAEVGLDLQLEVVEGSELWGTWENEGIELRGNFDLDLWDDGYYGLDPTTYMADYFDPRSVPNRDNPIAGLNVGRYRNPELIDIFDALYTPLPPTRRRVLLCELATILYQDLPQIPLLALPDFYAASIELENVAPHIYDTVTWNAGEWRLLTLPDN